VAAPLAADQPDPAAPEDPESESTQSESPVVVSTHEVAADPDALQRRPEDFYGRGMRQA
jgi:hypothetical protein